MKTNQMIWNIGRYMCLAVLVAFASCTRDEWTESVNTPQEEGLCFSLYADGDMKPAGTRSSEEDPLKISASRMLLIPSMPWPTIKEMLRFPVSNRWMT